MMEAKAIIPTDDYQLSKNFNMKEFWNSPTAKRKGIDNHIPEKYHKNLINLVQMLQVIRDTYGQPIIVGSGYRCPKLNKAVGGVTNSQHKTAAAADIKTVSDTFQDNKKLYDLIVKLANEGKVAFRQIIWEYGKKGVGPDWIHIAVNDSDHTYKKNQLVFIGI